MRHQDHWSLIRTRAVSCLIGIGAAIGVSAPAHAALVHRWTFEEPNGTGPPQVLNSVSSNHGTFVAMDDTNRSSDVPNALSTRSLQYNGTDERVDLGSRVNLLDTTDFTVALWYRGTESRAGTTNAVGRTLIGTQDSNAVWASLGINSGGQAVYYHYDGSFQSNIASPLSVSNDVWHHIAVVNHLNQTADLYIDGGLVDTGSSVAGATGSSDAFGFAIDHFMHGYNNLYTAGKIDDVRIYNHALTQSEVSALAAVPEPASFQLAIVGLTAVGLLRRRRVR